MTGKKGDSEEMTPFWKGEAARFLRGQGPRGSFLVVGDVMLDRYVSGDVERISPEAPVPVVRVEK